ncbi:hypothetical protein [Methylomonas fluvii]|uniref:Uncharacterized protein n=1 Tax=Methylomonas fluvii TaxID=1854564 RepID=A0ABR9D9I0_9GAMM|nr:hypothetical protein [Methylomonas fluvii]MBD9359605.1 hypothetical protein [Methylomonas fluvii]CAD6872345.1 hypothetical protein [Methylomonas fluvii]
MAVRLSQTGKRGPNPATGSYNQNITHLVPLSADQSKQNLSFAVGVLMISSCMRRNRLSFAPLAPRGLKATLRMQLVNALRTAKLGGIN